MLGPMIAVPCLQKVLMKDGCCTCTGFNIKSKCGRVIFKNLRFVKGTFTDDFPPEPDSESETSIGGPYDFEVNVGIDKEDLGEQHKNFSAWMQGAGPIPWWKYFDAGLWPSAVAPARSMNYISFQIDCVTTESGEALTASVYFGQFAGPTGAGPANKFATQYAGGPPLDTDDFEIDIVAGTMKINNWDALIAYPGVAPEAEGEYVRVYFDIEFYQCDPPCLEDCPDLCTFAFCIQTPECFGTCGDGIEGPYTQYTCSIAGVAAWNDRVQSWIGGGLVYSAGCTVDNECVSCEDYLASTDGRTTIFMYYLQVPLDPGDSTATAAFETITVDCADGSTFDNYTAGNLAVFTCAGGVSLDLMKSDFTTFFGPCGPEYEEGGAFSGTWGITCPDGPITISGTFDTDDCDGSGTGGGTPVEPQPVEIYGLCHFLPQFIVHHPSAGDGLFASVTTYLTEIGTSGVWTGGSTSTITFPGPIVLHANLSVVFDMNTEGLSVIVVITELGPDELILVTGDGVYFSFLQWMWPGQTISGGPGGTTFDIPVNWVAPCLIGG